MQITSTYTQHFITVHFLNHSQPGKKEKTYVQNNSPKKENIIKEKTINSLGITIIENRNSQGVQVSKVENEKLDLKKDDIILEVNREPVDLVKTFISLVNKYQKTGRSSLLLKIKRGEEISWITIKFN